MDTAMDHATKQRRLRVETRALPYDLSPALRGPREPRITDDVTHARLAHTTFLVFSFRFSFSQISLYFLPTTTLFSFF